MSTQRRALPVGGEHVRGMTGHSLVPTGGKGSGHPVDDLVVRISGGRACGIKRRALNRASQFYFYGAGRAADCLRLIYY